MNFTEQVLAGGGNLHPILPSPDITKSYTTFNPSIYNDDGKILVNLRGCSATFYHSECNKFEAYWPPVRRGSFVTYIPENDSVVVTKNYLCELDSDLATKKTSLVDTSLKDTPPIWFFTGMEDSRLVKWDGKYYIIGCRRDTTPNGVGCMELSGIDIYGNNVKEISRVRIKSPDNSYCEKNWMPIIDKPYHFVRWTNPVQIVRVNPDNGDCTVVHQSKNHLNIPTEIRGGSHVVPFADGYLFLTHEVYYETINGKNHFKYYHRFFYLTKNWEIPKYTTSFSFMDSRIEFCCGLCVQGNDLLISFGLEDNASYILRCPKKIIESVVL